MYLVFVVIYEVGMMLNDKSKIVNKPNFISCRFVNFSNEIVSFNRRNKVRSALVSTTPCYFQSGMFETLKNNVTQFVVMMLYTIALAIPKILW